MGILLLAAANLLFPLIAAGYLICFFLSPRRQLLARLKEELPQRFAIGLPFSKYNGRHALWIHAASVGEVKSIAAVCALLKEKNPDTPILITSTTTAGREEAKKIKQADACALAPLDFYPFASRFVRAFHPAHLLVVENELWPNMLCAAKQNGVKIAVLNGRLSAKSFRSYRFIKPLMSLTLSNIELALLQTTEIAARYTALGLAKDKAMVSGNIKYDQLNPKPSKKDEAAALLKDLWGGQVKIAVFGSTHPAEEDAAFSALQKLKGEGFRFVIAPRHLERMRDIEEKLSGLGLSFALLSRKGPKDSDLLLVDAMGWLVSFYALADVCFVGGTIAKKGGHNLLEPAIMGKPVLFGPHYYNTPDVAEKLIESKGGRLTSPAALAGDLSGLAQPSASQAAGRAALETAESFRGATKKTLDILLPWLTREKA